MIAVIGSGKRVITVPVTDIEFNIKTGLIEMLHNDDSITKIDTNKDKVVIKQGNKAVGIFNGGMNDGKKQ